MATRDLRIFLFYFHWKSGGICADCGRIVAIVAVPGGSSRQDLVCTGHGDTWA